MITKQTASLLYGHSFQLQDKEGLRWDITRVNKYCFDIEGSTGLGFSSVGLDKIGTDYKVRCRNYDQLTKPMENGEVPMEELFIMYGGGSTIESKKYWQNDFEDNIRYSRFDSLSFQLTSNLMSWHFKPSALTDEMCVWID